VNRPAHNAIVIGFLGGFTKRNEVKHPEVLFANYLNSRYSPNVHAAVFGNHEAKLALKFILDDIDADKHGSPASAEQELPKIILFGHSWGASQVLEFARELEQQKIPVALTIQIDSVRKVGQNDRTVPANVAKAVNFYQSKGFTAGRTLIIPADAKQTKVLGNLHMTYGRHDIRCDNYGWFSRVLNKPHHQIENDAQVWNQILALIDSEISNRDNLGASPFTSSTLLRSSTHADNHSSTVIVTTRPSRYTFPSTPRSNTSVVRTSVSGSSQASTQ